MRGKHLRLKLKEAGVSCADVARELGISKQSLNSRLNAEVISTETLEAAMRVSGRPASYFYDEEIAKQYEIIKANAYEFLTLIDALSAKNACKCL